MKLMAWLTVVMVTFALLNSNAFGGDTLIAYFLVSITAWVLAVVFFVKRNLKGRPVYPVPTFFWFFLLISIYVLIRGSASSNLGLRHYYWPTLLSVLFVTIQIRMQSLSEGSHRSTILIYRGIVTLALLETALVFLQCLGIVGVPSPYFFCTGSWSNPNVTAMFLAMSLYSFGKLSVQPGSLADKFKVIPFFQGLICLAILLLQSRTAVVATLLILFANYGQVLKTAFKKNFRPNLTGAAIGLCLLVILISLSTFFSSKSASTTGRLRIWTESLQLFSQQPLYGFGFGQFEKQFNNYTASLNLSVNDHVNMAYNDFIELAVEGGLIAVGLWIAFYVFLFKYILKSGDDKRRQCAVVAAFLFSQLVNFSIQAIPVMLLFVLYIGLMPIPEHNPKPKISLPGNWRLLTTRFYLVFGLAIALLFLVQIYNLTHAFYKQWRIGEAKQIRKSIFLYEQLKPDLEGFASYHEAYGTSHMRLKEYSAALGHFKKALKVSSGTELLTKCGYCYQQLGHFDSSEYYYRTVQQIQPHRFMPRLILLRQYMQQDDREKLYAQAKGILEQPVKIRSARVKDIKGFAQHVLDSLGKVSFKDSIQSSK